jgi:site-specific recombinase XerD
MTLAPKDMLTGPALEAWLDYARWNKEQAFSPRTVQNRGEALAQLAGYLRDHCEGATVLTATRHGISDYLQWVGATRSASTQLNRHRALHGFYRFAVDEEILTANPMERIASPSVEYPAPQVLSDALLAALLAACKAPKDAPAAVKLAALRDEAIIRIWCEAGSPRASEMAGLTLEDCDLETDTITVRGKRRRGQIRIRQIPLSASTARAVSKYRRARAAAPAAAGSAALWIGPKGALTRFGLGQMLGRRATAAGLGHVHPHQLRHTAFADFDEASGGHVNAEMALFGWSNPAMAHHYGKAAREAAALRTARELGRGNRLGRSA